MNKIIIGETEWAYFNNVRYIHILYLSDAKKIVIIFDKSLGSL